MIRVSVEMRRLICSLFLFCLAGRVSAQIIGHLDAKLVGASDRHISVYSEKGVELWRHQSLNVHDFTLLPNGNVLYADGNVHEVTPDHREVFTYRPKIQKGGGSYSCQRLPNGNTLIAENAAGRLVEVTPGGKVVFTLKVKFDPRKNQHRRLRMVRKLESGNYLVTQCDERIVREYTPAGKIVWEMPTAGWTFLALRLANGHTLISSMKEIVEVTPDKKVVWKLTERDIPGVKLVNLCGIQPLPNGNLVIGCYGSPRDKDATDTLELTRDKRCVWRFVNKRDRCMTWTYKLLPGMPSPLR